MPVNLIHHFHDAVSWGFIYLPMWGPTLVFRKAGELFIEGMYKHAPSPPRGDA